MAENKPPSIPDLFGLSTVLLSLYIDMSSFDSSSEEQVRALVDHIFAIYDKENKGYLEPA